MNARSLALLVSSVGVAVALAACPAEPAPPCPVASGSPLGVPSGGNPLFSLPDFWAKYTLTSANTTDPCAQLAGEEVGFQKFSIPSDLTNFTMALRTYRMGYQQGSALDYGAADSADDFIDDSDPANPVPGADPVIRQDPTDPNNLKMSAMFTLTPFPDSTNICHATQTSPADETFAEVDVQLVDGGTASTPLDPNEPLSGTAVIVDDGGVATAIFPTLHESYDWTDIQIVSTTAVPGSVFKGSVHYTQGTCTATYDVLGVWPLTPCRTDVDCEPVPVPDAVVCHNACATDSDCDTDHPFCDTNAGVCNTDSTSGVVCRPAEVSISTRLFQGSGLNPSFSDDDGGFPIKCHNDPRIAFILSTYGIGSDWGACEVSMPFDTLQTLH